MSKYQQVSWLSPANARAFLENLANIPDHAGPQSKGFRHIQFRIRELARRFPYAFEELKPFLNATGNIAGIGVKEPDDPFVMAVIGLARHIRAAWKASQNLREAEWIIFQLRQFYQQFSLNARPALQMSDIEINELGRRISRDLGFPTPQETNANVEAPSNPKKFDDMLSKSLSKLMDNFRSWGWWVSPAPSLMTFEQVMYRFQKMLPQARRCANTECENPYFFAGGRRRFCSGKCARSGQREYKLRWWNEQGKKRREQEQRHKKKSKGQQR